MRSYTHFFKAPKNNKTVDIEHNQLCIIEIYHPAAFHPITGMIIFVAVLQHTYIMAKAAKISKPAMPEFDFEQAAEKKHIKALATKAKKTLRKKWIRSTSRS